MRIAMRDRIGWKPRFLDPRVASTRIRCLNPLRELQSRNYPVELFHASRAEHYAAVVYSKLYDYASYRAAEALKKHGVQIVLDLCDNHFYNPNGLESLTKASQELRQMMMLADELVASTEMMAEVMRAELSGPKPITLISDAVETEIQGIRTPLLERWRERHQLGRLLRRLKREGRTPLVWFGIHGGPNADYGMLDLLKVKSALEQMNQRFPLSLTVISNSEEKYKKNIRAWSIPTHYLSWHPSTFLQALEAHSIAVIPISKNPFTLSKSNNRLLMSLYAGLAVVADSIPSYQPFADVCYLDDWQRGLESYLSNPELRRRHVETGRAIVAREWTGSHIADQWQEFFDRLLAERSAPSESFLIGTRLSFKGCVGRSTSESREAEPSTSLPDIIQWARSFDIHRKEWLILGKGPSYQFVENINRDDYYTCSLNHVVREHAVDLAHVIDIDVVDDCADSIATNARWLVLPYYPHVRHKPTSKSIHDFVKEMPVLQSLKDQGRLTWYNLSTSKKQVGSSPVIFAKFFSAEAAVNILATCGVKRIRSLGVDGGNSYAAKYEDLKTKTLLANTRSSFDRQFEQIAKTIRTRGIFYAPLHKQAPVQVFVGTDRSQMLAAKVLEYSIKKYASMSVNFARMCDVPVPLPKDPRSRPRTGFSFCRFLIPSLCNYRGRAIYLDADMLVFDDICKVWDLPMDDADIVCAEQPSEKGRVRQYSVMLMNCLNLPWKIEEIVSGLDNGRYDYAQLMYDFCIVPREKIAPTLPYEWNSLEFYEAGKTCLVHYTDMPTQPWVSYENKHGAVWYNSLREGIGEGFITKEELYREVEQGHVLPDLPQYIGLAAHDNYQRLAKAFVPPYKRFQNANRL